MIALSIIAAFLINLSGGTPVTVSTVDGGIVDGTTTLESFEMEMIFGEATVRLVEVDSISFDEAQDVVVIVDGTILRGKIRLDALELKTAKGEAKKFPRENLRELIVHHRVGEGTARGPEVEVDIDAQDGTSLRGMMRPARFLFVTSFGKTTLRMKDVAEITVGDDSTKDLVITLDKTVLKGRLRLGLIHLRTKSGVITLRREDIRKISTRST